MAPDVPDLATERLDLSPLALSDAEAVQAAFGQWEVVRHLNASIPWPYPEGGALSFIRDVALPAMRAGRPVLGASKAAENEASRRLSARQGMRVVAVEERDYVCGRRPSEIWEMTAEDWRAGCRP